MCGSGKFGTFTTSSTGSGETNCKQLTSDPFTLNGENIANIQGESPGTARDESLGYASMVSSTRSVPYPRGSPNRAEQQLAQSC